MWVDSTRVDEKLIQLISLQLAADEVGLSPDIRCKDDLFMFISYQTQIKCTEVQLQTYDFI